MRKGEGISVLFQLRIVTNASFLNRTLCALIATLPAMLHSALAFISASDRFSLAWNCRSSMRDCSRESRHYGWRYLLNSFVSVTTCLSMAYTSFRWPGKPSIHRSETK